jgi:hypothetical protein
MQRFLALLVGLLALSPQADGCEVCFSFQGNPLSLPHPRAIEIAVATRAALDKGLLGEQAASSAPSSAPSGGWNNREARSAAGVLQDRCEVVHLETAWRGHAPFSLHVVLIDTSETLELHVRGGQATLERQPRGAGDAVIATAYPGLQAIVAGRLAFDDAVRCGLVAVDGREQLIRVLFPRAVSPPCRFQPLGAPAPMNELLEKR